MMKITLDNEIQIGIRRAEPGDMPFVWHSWCKQARTFSPHNDMDAAEFRRHKLSIIDPLTAKSEVLMAVDASDDEIIHGYVVYHENTLVFCYVKGNLRGFGIGSAMMSVAFPEFKARPIYCVYQAQSFKKLKDSWMLKYDPFRAVDVLLA